MFSLRRLPAALAGLALATFTLSAHAEPLLTKSGKPKVVSAWSDAGGVVTLNIAEGFDSADVAEAIRGRLPKAKLRPLGDRLEVRGVKKAALLKAMRGVQVDRLLDDVDDMLASLQSNNGGDSDSGSSIRATQTGVVGRSVQLSGEVVNVRRKRFPVILLTVQLSEAAAGRTAGDRVVVIPQIRTKRGRPQDAASKQNLKAWYAQPGDKVSMQLVRPKQRVWAVTGYELKSSEY